ncbi:MAG: hypothetical protein K8I30_10385 [Anaerolineae bacterium]|nr:hypothetical protein [Anaerolineae bacterium]
MTGLDYGQARKQLDSRRRRRLFFRFHIALFSIGLILFFFWLNAQPFGYPIYLLPPALWAFLLLGHWFYHSTASSRDRAMERLWENMYDAHPADTTPSAKMGLLDAPDPFAQPSIEGIRQAVEVELTREKTRRRKLLFRINVAAYLGVMLLGWIVIPIIYGPFITESSALTIFALSIGGLVEVILHYMTVRLDTADGERALRERLLGQAIQSAMTDGTFPEKAKRVSHLTDDGELVDSPDWDGEEVLTKRGDLR